MTIEQGRAIVDEAIAKRGTEVVACDGRTLMYDGANHFFVTEGGERSYIAGSSNALQSVLAPVGEGHMPGRVQALMIEVAAKLRAHDRRHDRRRR